MTVIRNNSISGINSITAQSNSLNFYDTSGNTLSIGASVTGNVTGNLTGDVNAGVVTATSFQGDGSALTGIDATALKDSGDTIRVQANTSGAVVSSNIMITIQSIIKDNHTIRNIKSLE